jgi:hypothetical protein
MIDLKPFLLSSQSISFNVIHTPLFPILLPIIFFPLITLPNLSSILYSFLIILTTLACIFGLGELVPFLIMPLGG